MSPSFHPCAGVRDDYPGLCAGLSYCTCGEVARVRPDGSLEPHRAPYDLGTYREPCLTEDEHRGEPGTQRRWAL